MNNISLKTECGGIRQGASGVLPCDAGCVAPFAADCAETTSALRLINCAAVAAAWAIYAVGSTASVVDKHS